MKPGPVNCGDVHRASVTTNENGGEAPCRVALHNFILMTRQVNHQTGRISRGLDFNVRPLSNGPGSLYVVAVGIRFRGYMSDVWHAALPQ